MDDSISRQKAIEILGEHCKMNYNKICGNDCECIEYMALRDTPSAQKKGHWEVEQTYCNFKFRCSECGYYETHAYEDTKPSNFCPNCGADMRGD